MKTNIIFFLLTCTTVLSCAAPQRVAEGTIMTATQLLADVAKGGAKVYRDIVFEGDLDFTTLETSQLTPNNFIASVGAPLYFERCEFNGKVTGFTHHGDTAKSTRFMAAVSFQNCRFKADVDFRGATFQHHLYLNQSLFDSDVLLQASRIEGDFRIEKAIFNESLYLQEMIIKGVFWGKGATVLKQLSVQQADFWQNASFAGMEIKGYADFSLAHFRRSAFFEYGVYNDRVNYSGATFRQHAEWAKVRFGQAIDMSNTWFAVKPIFPDTASNESINLSGARFDEHEPEISK